jgi:GTP-binding protein
MPEKALPKVTIVGRPNVGKSTLFNRITGVRRAIVDSIAGSTRDRNQARASWAGKDFELVDTGGLHERPGSTLEYQVAAQCEVAIEEGDLVCWVVDAVSGLLPEDEALAQRLRQHADRVLLVVNKVDHERRHADAMEFHRLGFAGVFEISAEHGLGINELLDAVVERLPETHELATGDETRIAIVGRPNVGKSSLLNRLVGQERAVVSDMAGTTRDPVDTVIEVSGRRYRIVDTAGIRRRGKTPSRADRLGVIYAERALERAHLCLLVVDATAGLTTEDRAIAGKIVDAGRGAVLVFNKWDAVEDRERLATTLRADMLDQLPHLAFVPTVFVSALNGRGVSRILPLVDRVRDSQLQRIATKRLNAFLQAETARRPPRAKDGKEAKLLYMTQVGVAPPRFVVFGSRTRQIDPTYSRYLGRRIREEFGFEGTPIRVTLRQKAR